MRASFCFAQSCFILLPRWHRSSRVLRRCIQLQPHDMRNSLLPVHFYRLYVAFGVSDSYRGCAGTGKSTFIVELLRTRIPKHRKVLLCTTTNKAIDSLAEKICVTCGHESVVAVGNPHRLGATSITLTLDEKVKRHPSKEAWLGMCRKATYVLETYYNIQQNALMEARAKDAEEARSNGNGALNGETYTAHEAQVAASMALEMDAAKRVAEQAAAVIGLKRDTSKRSGKGRSASLAHHWCQTCDDSV